MATNTFELKFVNDASLERQDIEKALAAFRNALPADERED